MRTGAVALALAVLVVASAPRPACAQFSLDARRIGMGGLSLTRDGSLRRYNSAYRAVKDRAETGGGGAKFTIPIPFGLIQFLKDHPLNQLDDDPLFDPDSPEFNPIEALNLVLNPPLFYEVKEAPTPTNDVEFTIGKNALVIDLGAAQVLIPEDEFGLGGASRLLDMGGGVKGFRFSVTGFEHHEMGILLGDTLRAFLKEADSARTNTTYDVLGDGVVQAGFAPTLSFSGRVTGVGSESEDGIYLGAAVRIYRGVAFFRATGSGGFVTGDTLFAGPNPVTPDLDVLTYRDHDAGKTFGSGWGGDIGVVLISGPLEIGLGVNDIGAELTWKDTKVERTVFDTAGDSLVTTPIADHVESTTKLPVSYIANAAFRMGTGTTVGGDIMNTGRGTVIHVGGEQRFGPLALRGGVSRDQRKKMQFGWGGGVRLGFLSLDLGFWTHSNSFSDERGITMATSISVY